MSRRNWLPSPPIGVGIVLVLLLSFVALNNWQQHASYSNDGAPQHYGYASGGVQNVSPTPISGVQAPPSNPNPKRDEWRSESDLEAQWYMAKWAAISAIATCIGLVIGGLGLFFVKQTLDANRASVEKAAIMAETAERHMIASERPWVSVALQIGSDLKFKDYSGRITINFILKNVGKSPAVNVYVEHHIVAISHNAWDKLKEITEKAKSRKVKYILGHKIFPEDDFVFSISMPIERTEIEAFAAGLNIPVDDNCYVFPAVVGCAVYNSTLDEMNHITEFVAHLGTIDPQKPGVALGMPIKDEKIPASQLRLDLSFGGGSAD